MINFKNLAETELEFSTGIVCFTGKNGSGKTNLLDAIHYLSLCKSYFNPIDSQNIQYDSDFFMIQGTYQRGDEKVDVYCGIKRNHKKKFKRNKQEYTKLAEHIGYLPLVMISPADIELVHGGSEQRRKFIDNIISQNDREYLEQLIRYNKVLAQRNALLKNFAVQSSFNQEALEIWDYQLIETGNHIYKKRVNFIEDFIPIFNKYYVDISNGNENVGMSYISQLANGNFKELLDASISKDRTVQFTTAGIHKDELVFSIDKHPIKKFGSQGQQKSFLVALKLAKFEFIRETKGFSPILLLDDIFDKLDADRVKRIVEVVNDRSFGQVFITDTNSERLKKVFDGDLSKLIVFEMENGILNQQNESKISV